MFDVPMQASSSTATSAMSDSGGDVPTVKINKRPKTGCLTCRLRKKRCDERKPGCATCERLGIDCLGYGHQRPDWLQKKEVRSNVKEELKRKIRNNRSVRIVGSRDDDEGSGAETNLPEGRESGTSVGPDIMSDSVFDTSVMGQSDFGNGMGQATWEDAIPEIPRNVDQPGSAFNNDNGDMANPFGAYDAGTGFAEVWKLIFGQEPPAMPPNDPNGTEMNGSTAMTTNMITDPNQLFLPPSAPSAPDTSLLSLFSPPSIPTVQTSLPPELPFPVPDLTYLHHYLNVVLPLQYRFVVRAMADLVAPLALSNPDVLKSASSLAALHLAASKAKQTTMLPWEGLHGESGLRLEEKEQAAAMTMHRDTIERLRFVSPEELTTEGVVLPALFALSYYLFLGGTSRDWGDVLGISRRCLSAAFTASPEITGGPAPRAIAGQGSRPSPWKRYRPLMCAMVWMDIVGSVSQNKVTRLLPIYRNVLAQAPAGWGGASKRERLRMDKVVGCDDTTFLAIAETVALSEWRDGQDDAGCLSLKELVHRAGAIEKILDERTWREDTMAMRSNNGDGVSEDGDAGGHSAGDMDAAIVPVMSEIFYNSARVLLATVVHGPYPRVPEVASAVQETAEALHRLDTLYPIADVNRALIFPITIAGCHCDTPAQQAFFRNRFAGLGAEAEAFGNSKQALTLLEEVWRRRADGVRTVNWRKVMRDLGWESGILLI